MVAIPIWKVAVHGDRERLVDRPDDGRDQRLDRLLRRGGHEAQDLAAEVRSDADEVVQRPRAGAGELVHRLRRQAGGLQLARELVDAAGSRRPSR